MFGAMTAFSTSVSPQCGQAISRPLLRLEAFAVAEPGLEFVVGRAAQREQDHPSYLLTRLSIPEPTGLAIICPTVLTKPSKVDTTSSWVRRFAPLIRPGGQVLDLAAGSGRHTALLLDMGLRVTAVDRDVAALMALAGRALPVCRDRSGATATRWRLGGEYDGIVVTNYLHRPLFAGSHSGARAGRVLDL